MSDIHFQLQCDCGGSTYFLHFGKGDEEPLESEKGGTLIFVCSNCGIQQGGVEMTDSSYEMLLDAERMNIEEQLKNVN